MQKEPSPALDRTACNCLALPGCLGPKKPSGGRRNCLQGGLGDLNDIAVDKSLIAGVAPSRHGFAAGLLTGREEARENKAMLAAVEGHKDFLKVKSFWR
jgi:hypothetical protein